MCAITQPRPGPEFVKIARSPKTRVTLGNEVFGIELAVRSMTIDMKITAIACGGIGFKAAFAHGVLSALETHEYRAKAYAGASLAVMPAMRAAAGIAASTGVNIWLEGLATLRLPGNSMSDFDFSDIASFRPLIAKKRLFSKDAPRLCIATSAVHTIAGAIEAQGPRAGALGRRLQVHAGRNDRSWASENLTAHVWDTEAPDRAHRLTPDNFEEALYASTRLLTGWSTPAEVDGIPFVDAAYTCACPALELAAMEYREVIAIGSETGPIYRDIFHSSVIPEMAWRSRVRVIRPAISPKSMGVEETAATEHGLISLYDHGLDQGLRFITEHLEAVPDPSPAWDWPKRAE